MAVDPITGEEIIIQPAPEVNRSQERITELSGKVRTAEEGRQAADKAREEAEAKFAEAERNAAFAEGFSDIVANNPAAKDHKEDIRAKVKSGYTVEDATYAVLGKAGKLNQNAPVVDSQPIAGGSATITPPQGGKSPGQMTREERKTALIEAERRGDLSIG